MITKILSVLILKKKLKFILSFLYIILISTVLISIINFHKIWIEYAKYMNNILKPTEQIYPIIHLSKEKKNIIIFMMDRALSSFIPIIFDERPELKQIYTGFKYYPNTVSYYGHTILGVPPILGGYEYIPENFEKMSGKFIDNRDEAIFMLPVLFKKRGYSSILLDPDWVEGKEFPDDTKFKKSGIEYERIQGKYTELYQ